MNNGWINLITGIALLLAGGCGTVFWYFYRLDAKRIGETQEENTRKLEALGAKVDSHARQIRDTRAALACCETELKIEHYPYTD